MTNTTTDDLTDRVRRPRGETGIGAITIGTDRTTSRITRTLLRSWMLPLSAD